ncbi:MAG: ABC transporter substrate-binding protein [Chitinophagaceae bacterium]|nr:ABC transporter substrate-binding protein [Oligoflexus sp.]
MQHETKEKSVQPGRTLKDMMWAILPFMLVLGLVIYVAIQYVDPPTPTHIIMATGDPEGAYQEFAKRYQDILKKDGVELEIRPSAGANDNLKQLMDPDSDVDVGFVQDGLGTPAEADYLESLGSLYYEPLWLVYRGKNEITRFSELLGKRLAIGQAGDGLSNIARRVLKESGVLETNTTFVRLGWDEALAALKRGEIDAAFFMTPPEDDFIETVLADPENKLMNTDQAEAISRQIPYLHHVVLPHGVIDLKRNIPSQDIHLLAPTNVLLTQDSLNPALKYLLLKAAAEVHSEPGILERKGEFPIDKDFVFPLSSEAASFYKSGVPFWQKHMPFWLATVADRFLLIIIPSLAVFFPLMRLVPRVYHWRIRARIYKSYGELKYLETQTRISSQAGQRLERILELDRIEDRVNQLKVPLEYTDHIYSLRGHIEFVRERLRREAGQKIGTQES